MEFKELIQARRSVRNYKEEPVSEEIIRELIEESLMAPSWKNYQPARYYVASTPEKKEALLAAMPGFNQKSAKNATLIVTSFVKDKSGFTAGNPDNELGNKWGSYDLGVANAYFILAAKDKGLDTLIMGLRDANEVRKVFNIPKTEYVGAIIAIGYADETPVFYARKAVDDVLTF